MSDTRRRAAPDRRPRRSLLALTVPLPRAATSRTIYTSPKHLARRARGVPRAARRPRRRPALAQLRHVGARLLAWSASWCSSASAGSSSTCRSRSASPPSRPTAPGTPRSRFVTNTNWQWYSGEAAIGHLMQMSGLTVQNFVSAAVGMAVAAAFARGLARTENDGRVGNFWADLVRSVVRVLLPISLVAARAPGRPRRRPELRRPHDRCTTLDRRQPDRHRRPGRQPGGDQGARHQRRRLLQRQLRAPVREPDAVHQPARDLPAPAHPVRDGVGVRPDRQGPPPGHRRRSP